MPTREQTGRGDCIEKRCTRGPCGPPSIPSMSSQKTNRNTPSVSTGYWQSQSFDVVGICEEADMHTYKPNALAIEQRSILASAFHLSALLIFLGCVSINYLPPHSFSILSPFLPLLNQRENEKISPSSITASSELRVPSVGKCYFGWDKDSCYFSGVGPHLE